MPQTLLSLGQSIALTLVCLGIWFHAHAATTTPIAVVLPVVTTPNVVEVTAADSTATEPIGNTKDLAVFVIRRTGSTDFALPVNYEIGGSAQAGVDYVKLAGTVTIPIGKAAVEIPVTPLADSLAEGVESVAITLTSPICPAIFPPPVTCYTLGNSTQAKVLIQDAPSPVSGKLEIVKPAAATVIPVGAPVTVDVAAADARGPFTRVELFADEISVGVSTLSIPSGMKAGEVVTHSFTWLPAKVGTHSLVARGLDSGNNLISSAVVKVDVVESVAPQVVRSMPATFAPGGVVDVSVRITPAKGTLAYALEEMPPQGWTVVKTSEGGVADLVQGKVKFGPFFDATARTVTYQVRAVTTLGTFVFKGQAAFDSKTVPVTGVSSITWEFPYHPADSSPKDRSISLSEVVAYGSTWKAGKPWTSGPNPIPAAYVTKAAALWKAGERYDVNGSLGVAPAWWTTPIAMPLTNSVALPDGSNNLILLTTNNTMMVIRQALRPIPLASVSTDTPTRRGEAVRSIASSRSVARVSLEVSPVAASAAYAVVESIPSGWTASAVDNGGSFDPAAGEIRWLFLDATARTLRYDLRPMSAGAGSGARLAGLVSVDGLDAAVQGDARLSSPSGVRIQSLQRGADGLVALSLDGATGGAVRIEASEDLRGWTPVFSGPAAVDDSVVVEETAPSGAMRFYRVITE